VLFGSRLLLLLVSSLSAKASRRALLKNIEQAVQRTASNRIAGANLRFRRPSSRGTHPELVGERIGRFAGLVGRARVIASTDCGLGSRVHPQIAWAKLDRQQSAVIVPPQRSWGGVRKADGGVKLIAEDP
jgi:hypothetical protein